MSDIFTISDFLNPAEIAAIVSEMQSAHAVAATVYGGNPGYHGTVDDRVRMVARLTMSPETRQKIAALLLQQKARLEQRFGVALTHCEEPHFLRYEVGNFFVAHQDGNTPMIYDHTRFRKVSVSIYLSQQSSQPGPNIYGDGELVLHGAYPNINERHRVVEPPGTLVAFRSEVTHEVLPISHGVRHAIVSWFRSDEPKITKTVPKS